MADHDVDPAKLEEDRLMRALSRQGKPATVRSPVTKRAEPEPVAHKKEPSTGGAVPKWKQAQLDREEEEKKRRGEEAKKKEDAAKLIQDRVKEFGLGVNQDDESVEKYLTSPRGAVEKPSVAEASPSFEDPAARKAAEAAKSREEELESLPRYDDRGNDERAAKEEERLMKMIAGKQ